MPATVSSKTLPNLEMEILQHGWETSSAHIEIASPQYFEDLLSAWQKEMGAADIGLVIVPQEGRDAGDALAFPPPDSMAKKNERETIKSLQAALTEGSQIIVSHDPPASFTMEFIAGNFERPIGFLWCVNGKNVAKHLKKYADFIADHVEKSKKSRLHQYLANHFAQPAEPSYLYQYLAETLQKGLYNEMVVIWEPDPTGFSSFPNQEWDLIGRNNMVNKAFKGETIIVPNVAACGDPIYFKDELEEAEINSFILMPMDTDLGNNSVKSVVGVFYKRVGGTTNVDVDLISYIVQYFSQLSALHKQSVEMHKKLEFFNEILQFHEKCVDCMTELHEFPPIFGSLEGILDTIAANSKSLSGSISDGKSFIKRGQVLLNNHGSTFSHASSLHESVVLPEDPDLSKVHLKEFIENFSSQYRHLVSASGATINFDLDDAPAMSRIDLEYFRVVLDNYISNACHAMKQPQQGAKLITIGVEETQGFLKLSVKDTGPGIEPWLLPHVFTKGVTSRKSQGGRGLGLALVWRIGLHYGREPTVGSVWGFGATFTSWLKHHGRYDEKGRSLDKR